MECMLCNRADMEARLKKSWVVLQYYSSSIDIPITNNVTKLGSSVDGPTGR